MSAHPIPAEALSQHLVVLGKTGSGKSYAVRSAVENLLDQRARVCIVDPTSVWWGLRSSPDGRRAGFPVVIFGGNHADLPLEASHGEAIAEVIGTSNTPAIIDTKLMKISDRTRFFTDFAEALMRFNRGPLHLVIDEAHRFAPKAQKMSPQSGAMLAAANELVSAGRSAGLRVILVTQRPSKLHNDSLTQVATLIAMKVIAPHDRRAVEDWIKDNADEKKGREIISSLATLKIGHGWIWCPELNLLERVVFPRIRTFDSGSAPVDLAAAGGEVLAPIDRDTIAERLKTVAADAIANDPATLRYELEQARRQLAVQPSHDPDPAAMQAEYERGYRDGHFAGRNSATKAAAEWLALVPDMIKVQLAEGNCILPANYAIPIHDPRAKPERSSIPVRSADRATGYRRGNGHDHSPTALGTGSRDGKRRILIALAQFPNGLSQRRMALLSNLVHGSGTWTKYLGALRSAGLVDGTDPLLITAAGRKAVGPFDPLPTGEGLRRYWANWLGGGGERRIFEALLAVYPKSMSTHQCAARANLVLGSGTWTKYLGRLRSLKLVTGRGELRASEELFQ